MAKSQKNGNINPIAAAVTSAVLALGAQAANAQDKNENTDFGGKAKIQLSDPTLETEAATNRFGAFGSIDRHAPFLGLAGYRKFFEDDKTEENSVSGSGAGTTFTNVNTETKDERVFYGGRLSAPPLWDLRLFGGYWHRKDITNVEGDVTVQIPAIGFTSTTPINQRIETELDEYDLGLWKRFKLDEQVRTLDIALGKRMGNGATDIGTPFDTDIETVTGYLAAMADFSDDTYGWLRATHDRINKKTGSMKDVFKRYEAELGMRFPLFGDRTYGKLWGSLRDEEGDSEADGGEGGLEIGCGVPNRTDRRWQWAGIMNGYLPDELKAHAQGVTDRERDLEAGTYWAFGPRYFKYGDLEGGSITAIYQRVLDENYALHFELSYGLTRNNAIGEDSHVYGFKGKVIRRGGLSFGVDLTLSDSEDRRQFGALFGVTYDLGRSADASTGNKKMQ